MFSRHRRLLAATAVGATALIGAPWCGAATNTTTFSVSALISSACNLTAANLSFGTYNPTSGTPLDASSNVNVFCTVGTAYTLALDVGTGGGAYTARTIASGANTLNYNLYTTAARSTVWGDGTGATGTVAGTGVGLLTSNVVTVYGRVTAAQDKPPGTYASTITVTVNF